MGMNMNSTGYYRHDMMGGGNANIAQNNIPQMQQYPPVQQQRNMMNNVNDGSMIYDSSNFPPMMMPQQNANSVSANPQHGGIPQRYNNVPGPIMNAATLSQVQSSPNMMNSMMGGMNVNSMNQGLRDRDDEFSISKEDFPALPGASVSKHQDMDGQSNINGELYGNNAMSGSVIINSSNTTRLSNVIGYNSNSNVISSNNNNAENNSFNPLAQSMQYSGGNHSLNTSSAVSNSNTFANSNVSSSSSSSSAAASSSKGSGGATNNNIKYGLLGLLDVICMADRVSQYILLSKPIK